MFCSVTLSYLILSYRYRVTIDFVFTERKVDVYDLVIETEALFFRVTTSYIRIKFPNK